MMLKREEKKYDHNGDEKTREPKAIRGFDDQSYEVFPLLEKRLAQIYLSRHANVYLSTAHLSTGRSNFRRICIFGLATYSHIQIRFFIREKLLPPLNLVSYGIFDDNPTLDIF